MDVRNAAVSLVGRAGLAAIFIWSGVGKIVSPEATQAAISSLGVLLPVEVYWLTIFVELGGGLALLAGIASRVSAAALAAFSLVTAFAFHGDLADQGQLVHLMKNLSIAGGLLLLVANGPGAWSFGEPKPPGPREAGT